MKLCINMTFLEKSLFNFTTYNDFETNRNENTTSKKSTEMKYFEISELVSVKFPFRTPLLVCSLVQ